MRTKSSPDTAKAFAKMIEKVQPQKIWSDRGTEFKGEFESFCNKKVLTPIQQPMRQSRRLPSANIRSLKNIIYKHLENKWTYHYIKKLPSFVINTINS